MTEEISLKYVLETEIKTFVNTEKELNGFIGIFEDSINTLFQLQHYMGRSQPDPESPDGHFYFFCAMNYFQVPYTFLSIYNIWKTGYYYESVILLRTLVEIFVKMRYFQNNADKISSFILRKKRITYKEMFDSLAPKLYESLYSLLSNFAHGGLSMDIIRTEGDDRVIVMGCQYNENKATFVVNTLNVVLLGYMNYFPLFFLNNTINENRELKNSFDRNINYMMEAIESHKKAHPRSNAWYESILPLVS